MPAFEYFTEKLLDPIAGDSACGTDLRYDRAFSQISEARRSDEELNEGDWKKEGGRKAADWRLVASLCISALVEKTKDIRLSVFLTEAAVRIDGFTGLRDCLQLTKELLRRYWDKGLFPAVEDGDLDFRAGPLIWLNERLPEFIVQVPITARSGAENYGLARYQQAQRVRSADSNSEQRKTVDSLLSQGWITMEQFEAALRASAPIELEGIYDTLNAADHELLELEKVVDEKFGASAPTFSNVKEAISEIRKVLGPAVKKKPEEEQSQTTVGGIADPRQQGSRLPNANDSAVNNGGTAPAREDAWASAENLLQSGKIDEGLVEMASLSSREVSGRGRFLRKLTLSDACLSNGRDRLARVVLEELSKQIDDFKLDQWENSGVVGAVWSRLYKLYRRTGDSSDLEQASDLYKRLCHLDPWQAYLSCEE